METLEIKKPLTGTTIDPLIQKRWSPRAFSQELIPEETMNSIFTAASWAPSAMNEQPWQYIYAERGTPAFDRLWDCLVEGNQPWTKDAAVIFVALYNRYYERNGRVNRNAAHDLGMANAQLLLQAASQDVYGHILGGFDADQLIDTLELSDDQVPFCMGVLGYLGNPDDLEEPYRSRERAKRSRKELNEFVTKL
ncbi:nitroreductase family protein [Maribellus sediminis]|uniref:nitroreductase family protein n=1 Tax=Maribellus sediminis TaxID=2696285 RepID=UPI001430DFBA|nr:nitroreductase family protein [Maribellus sediminis]